MNPSGSAFSGEVRCHVWKIPVHGQSFSTYMDLAIIEIRQVVIPASTSAKPRGVCYARHPIRLSRVCYARYFGKYWDNQKESANSLKETGPGWLPQRRLGLSLGTEKKNWPIADQCVTRNDPTNRSGTHFGSSSSGQTRLINLRWQRTSPRRFSLRIPYRRPICLNGAVDTFNQKNCLC